MKNKKIIGLFLMVFGILVAISTHSYMIYQYFNGQTLASMMMLGHAIINIVASILIIIGLVLKN